MSDDAGRQALHRAAAAIAPSAGPRGPWATTAQLFDRLIPRVTALESRPLPDAAVAEINRRVRIGASRPATPEDIANAKVRHITIAGMTLALLVLDDA